MKVLGAVQRSGTAPGAESRRGSDTTKLKRFSTHVMFLRLFNLRLTSNCASHM